MTKELLFLNPVFTHNIWGGTNLKTKFGYDVDGDDIGECWGISAHEHENCRVASGRYKGSTLADLWHEHPDLFGNYKSDRFPLLTKIIDAKDDLSIQVHPDDEYAAVHEDGSYGKMECWYILDCKEDATIVIGHNARTREELADMINNGKWSEFIREIPIKKGDFIQIDPGTVHAIKGGTMILESQQNSDITYRVYDYDRLSDGKPRELHVKQSIDVITVPAKEAKDSIISTADMEKNTLCQLISCDRYNVFKIDVDGNMNFEQNYPFMLVSVVDGMGEIDSMPVNKGTHLIIPNNYGRVCVSGKLVIIASTPI